MTYNAEVFMRNVYHVNQLFDKDSIRPISHFQSLGLRSENIAYIWSLCESILKSGKYDGISCNWCDVDLNGYNIYLKIFGHVITLKEVKSRKFIHILCLFLNLIV